MKQRNLWPLGIILTFVLFLSGTIGLVIMACAHPVDLVSANYYDQEIRFQDRLDQAGRARAAGASIRYEKRQQQIRIILSQPAPVGRIDLYRPSATALDQHIDLNASTGEQLVDASRLAPGLWKVRVSWTAAGQNYFLDQAVIIAKK